jgi:ribosomal protein L32
MLSRFRIEVTAGRRKRRVTLADIVNMKPVNTDRQTGKGRLNPHTVARFGERRATDDLTGCVLDFCLSASRFERTRSGFARWGLG